MNVLCLIKNFDNKIKEEFESLSVQIDNDLEFDFSQSKEFVLSEKLDTSIFDDIPNEKGVYLFEAKLDSKIKGDKLVTKVNNFAKKYSLYKNRHVYSSKVIKTRLKEKVKNQKDEWLPIYIGKNRNVCQRIKQHIDLSTKSRTYAMKLKSRKELHGLSFRISSIIISVENYDLLMSFVEKKLRDKYKPIIGKQ